MELEVVIQDVVAEPCALLLEDSSIFKVGFRVGVKALDIASKWPNTNTLCPQGDSRCGG
jgi:hypothetical protein